MATGVELPVLRRLGTDIRALDVAQKKIRCDLHLRSVSYTSGYSGDIPWMAEGMPCGVVGAGSVAGEPVGDGARAEPDGAQAG